MSRWINPHDRVILTICEHIGAEETVGVGGSEGVGVNEPADGKVVVPALEVVKARLTVVIVTTVAKRVDVPDEGRIRGLFAVSTMHGIVAPRAVVVGGDEHTGGIQKGNDVALRVKDVVVERRGRAVVIDHGERLVAVVVDKLKRFAVPLLTHDLAGERGVIVRRAVDRFAGANAGHVVGVLHGLAIHDGLCKLAPLRPREGIVLAVVVRDGVAGGREVARLGLAFVEDVLRGAAGRHAREQIRPRGVRVAKGLRDRAVLRDAPDVARRVVGIAEGRAAAVLLRCKLALRVVGILLQLRRLGHARALGHDLGDVASLVIGIREAAAVRTELVARARQTRAHPVAATVSRDAVVGIGAVIDLGLLPVLVGHRDRLFLKLAEVVVLVLRRDGAPARNRGRDGADRAIDLFAVTILAGVGIALPERVAAELPRLRCEPVAATVSRDAVVGMLRFSDADGARAPSAISITLSALLHAGLFVPCIFASTI